MGKKRVPTELIPAAIDDAYSAVLADVTELLESARRTAARSVNSIMTATYWAVGRRIVEFEQEGKDRAAYGTRLIARLAGDLTKRFGRGFGPVYERTLLSRDKAAMLRKAQTAKPEDAITPEEEIKDPFLLEFLDLKDEYSESDLEESLIRHLQTFLLELGDDFTFVG